MANLKDEARSKDPTSGARADMRLELVVIPVSDVDRAKAFYAKFGWRLDADFAAGDDWRAVQFTPPGSGCSVIFGKNVTPAAPGSAQGLYLVVSDIEAARNALLRRGVQASEVFHGGGSVYAGPDEPYRLDVFGSRARTPSIAATDRLSHSVIQTATAGCCKRSRPGFPDVGSAWTLPL